MVTRFRAAALVAAVLVGAGTVVSAHRTDEVAQAARLAIDVERVTLSLDVSPGTAVAETFLERVDRNADRRVSDSEARQYIADLERALSLTVDGASARLTLARWQADSFSDLAAGQGSIRVEFAAEVPTLRSGRHALVFQNAHQPELSAYLANTLAPVDPRIAILDQKRDTRQRQLEVTFSIGPAWSVLRSSTTALGGLSVLAALVQFRRSQRRHR